MLNKGGNKINRIQLFKKNNYKKKEILSNTKYFYYEYYSNLKLKEFHFKNKGRCYIYNINSKKPIDILFKDFKIKLSVGSSLEINNSNFFVIASFADFIVCGKNQTKNKKFSFYIKDQNKIYKVSKPWGYELWITGKNNRDLCLKKIFIKSGNKTSLQYHKLKREVNFLYEGKSNLHFYTKKFNERKFQINLIKKKLVKEGEYISINPFTVHRLESITNITLYEVSTPHLDDVIRLADDTNRKNGKIISEHKK